jgi:type IV secretory pathway VirB3-like protein
MADLQDTVHIPKGAVHVRTLARLPLEVTLLLGGGVMLFCLAFHSFWPLLVVVPVWGFAKWHAHKDPHFCKTWSGQLSYKPYYRA